MNKKCLFTSDYGCVKMDAVRTLGYDVLIVNEKEITYDESMKNVEILVCHNPFKTLDISKLTELKWIQLSSAGIDQVPKEMLKNKNIIITNNRGSYSIPMGEWIVLKILEFYKRSFQFYKNQLSRKWSTDNSLLELCGRTVGFIGTGTIAVEGAKRLQGFDINILGVNTDGRKIPYINRCYCIEELDSMLLQCDVVVISIPYTEKTHHMINSERINKMKNGTYIINIARGSVIDENALIEHLKDGKLKGAALDVFEKEPLEETSPLWEFENVIITPHNSWISERRHDRRFEIIYRNLKKYINGEELVNVINLNKGY